MDSSDKMLPDDKNKDSTATEEPVTPEFDLPLHSSNLGCVLPSAPKGKPRAAPLIRRKVPRTEAADMDNPVSNGSKIPLLKSKFTESDERNKKDDRIPKKIQRTTATSACNNDNSTRERRLENISHRIPEIQTFVEKVRVSRGIEMKRVVHDSNSVKPKRVTSGHKSPVASSSNGNAGEKAHSSKMNMGSDSRRPKMSKTEAECFTDVKSYTFTGHFRTHGKTLCKQVVPGGSQGNAVTAPKTANSDHVKTSEGAVVPEPSTSYKTVNDFLKMPETSLPDKQNIVNGNKKRKVYKSKFWEELDPTSKKPSKSAAKIQKKPYDPEDVKGFIQKQKEMRRVQQIKESKEKQQEYEKRHRMLKELDSKCQRIASKAKHRCETSTHLHQLVDEPPKKSKVQMESPSMKYLKPLLTPRKQGSLLKKPESVKSETAKQAQYLLAEFENIVKRECISFLQKIPAVGGSSRVDNAVKKTDKAVGTSTTTSFVTNSNSGRNSAEFFYINDGKAKDSPKHSLYPSPEMVEKAAAKIQALYRGYKVRKCLREAKISTSFSMKKKHLENELQTTQRRWSFPRMPEKPYDNSKLLPMSPIPMVATSDPAVPGYIPPPPITSQAPRSPSRPKVLPTFPLTPGRYRVYDEPYPKQLNQSSNDLRIADNFLSGSQQQVSRSSQFLTPNKVFNRPSLPTHVKINSTDSNPYLDNKSLPILDLVIPTPLPSIVDVLREKVRMFVDDNKNIATCVQSKLLEKSKSVSATYGTDFESDIKSSEKIKSRDRDNTESTENNAVNDEQNVNLAGGKVVTDKTRKPKKRRSRSKTSIKDGSTTTVDTDVELASSTSRSSMSTSKRQRSSTAAGDNQTIEKSEESAASSSAVTESSFGNFLAPALRLRYEAEKERLQIIEKALHIKLQNKVPEGTISTANLRQPASSQPEDEQSKKRSHESDRLQLAIANCQKESMKAAAEMTKWLSEFRKTVDHDKAEAQRTPLDIATMVYTAVEQARHLGEEKRREKVQKEQSDQNILRQAKSTSPNEVAVKADKSVETSLILMENYQKNIQRMVSDVQINGTLSKDKLSKDYQQQYPSGSERNSPVPPLPGVLFRTFQLGDSKPLPNDGNLESDDCSHSQIENTLEFEYQSIIPSGNTIEFTSMGPKISSIEYDDSTTCNDLSQKDATSIPDTPDDDLQQSEDVNHNYENIITLDNSGTFEVDRSDHHEKGSLSLHKSSSLEESEPSEEILNSQDESTKQHSDDIADYNANKKDLSSSYEKVETEHTNEGESIPEVLDEFTEKLSEHDTSKEELSYTSIQDEATSEKSEILEKVISIDEQEHPKEQVEARPNRVLLNDKSEDLMSDKIGTGNSIMETEIPESTSNSNEQSEWIRESMSQNSIKNGSLHEERMESDGKNITEKPVSMELPLIISESDKAPDNPEEVIDSCGSAKKDVNEVDVIDQTSPEIPISMKHEDSVPSIIDEIPSENAENRISDDSENESIRTDQNLSDRLVQNGSKVTGNDNLDDEISTAAHIQAHDVEEELSDKLSNQQDFIQDSIHAETVSDEVIEEDISVASEINVSVSEHPEEQFSEHIEDEESLVVCDSSEKSGPLDLGHSEPPSSVIEPDQEEKVSQEHLPSKTTSFENVETLETQVLEQDIQTDVLTTKKLDVDGQHDEGTHEEPVLHSEIEAELPLKPVPPYSPSSSLDSTSLSSRSLIISLEKNKLESIIQQQTDLIWQAWNGNGSLPSVQTIVKMNSSNIEVQNSSDDKGANDAQPEAVNAAIQSFDTLLYHLVYETIKEVLQVENSYTPYIERVRPGPLSLQAQRLRIPRTRESLVNVVMKHVVKIIPKTFFADPQVSEIEKPKLRKWCSRPRELVDEVLLEELVEEDYQWTEWWPEEVIVLNQVSEKIVKSLIRDTLKKHTYVHKH
ncbi:hypothetical protein Ocin01_06441 [Orchesella cincta]|uniref:Uncharacterized protein n=1 Tax=Orchesella cincta TaxID=48709 RepID=A0A1D2N4Q2_ORCCI|nr:hypothetical protein Ocin01_06441 [Orchesella cincta]